MRAENHSGSHKDNSGGNGPEPRTAQETVGIPQKTKPPQDAETVGKLGVVAYIGEIVLAGLCGTGVWIFGEHLVTHGYSRSGVAVNFLAFVIYFAAAPITAIRFWSKPKWVWGAFGIFCLFMAVIFAVTSSIEPKPKPPHFILSLHIGDSPDSVVLLTNDFLFYEDILSGSNRPDGSFLFKGYVYGCLVIPIMPGESNKVFNINAESVAPGNVHDLQCFAAVPKAWKCLVDSKWHPSDPSLIIPQYKLEITNVQGWSMQIPWVMHQYDIATLPGITNCSIEAYSGPESIGGLLSVGVRAEGLNDVLSMNVIFVPSTPESSKPFVTRGFIDSEGELQVPFPLRIPSLFP